MMEEKRIREVAQLFGVECKSINKAEEAVLAEVYLLDNRLILRGRTLNTDTQKNFAREQSLIKMVKSRVNLQFPNPQKALSGKNFVMAHNYFWTLYPKIEGRVICTWYDLKRVDEVSTKTLFLALKNLHEQTRGIFKDGRGNFLKDVQKRFERVKNLLSKDIVQWVEKTISRVSEIDNGLNPREKCFVHGDFHFGNVLFDEESRVIGALDTDWCRVGSHLEDLAYTVMMLMKFYDSEKFCFNQERFSKLKRWYGLEPKEERNFGDYLILYALFDVDVFNNVQGLQKKEYYFNYQKSVLEDFCRRFS